MQVVGRAGGGGKPLLEIHLSRKTFATGRSLSGVVVLRAAKPVNIRALTISVTGREKPVGPSLARALRVRGPFFHREVLLSGMSQPRLASDRLSRLWNALLGRDSGRCLSVGEHVYPFTVQLPASLPPTYTGTAGVVDYRVATRLQFPAGGCIKAFADVPVAALPRLQRTNPVAISYPDANEAVQPSDARVTLTLSRQMAQLGQQIDGHFVLDNPNHLPIPSATLSLEVCEWVRLQHERELHRERVDSCTFELESGQESTKRQFSLTLPKNAPPTVEGTAISVIWLLKMNVASSPPVELKVPLAVYSPAGEN